MFAYCLNNPINRVDLSGTVSIWWYLLIDSEWGYIHRCVQDHIQKTQDPDLLTEVTIQNRGRADIVANDSGTVWEVKHSGVDPVSRMLAASFQALGYVGGTYKANKLITGLGCAGAFAGGFEIAVGTSLYEVKYYTPVPGVVLYTVSGEKSGNSNYAYVYTYVPHEDRSENDETNKFYGEMFWGAAPLILPITSGGGGGVKMQGFASYLY